MASDEDNFDIDVYGDGEEDKTDQPAEASVDELPTEVTITDAAFDNDANEDHMPREEPDDDDGQRTDAGNGNRDATDVDQAMSTDDAPAHQSDIADPTPHKQGVKRKEGPDDRPIDNGATSAVIISDLHWWSTDDDIRGWANQARCEDELKEITFSEHKVNGKSKRYV